MDPIQHYRVRDPEHIHHIRLCPDPVVAEVVPRRHDEAIALFFRDVAIKAIQLMFEHIPDERCQRRVVVNNEFRARCA